MTTKTILASLLPLLVSCKHIQQRNEPQHNIPKALDDESKSYEIVSKRGYDDLVESLYKEVLEKDAALKALEGTIQSLNESKNDSTESFDGFNGKNQHYYTTANAHIDRLSDSLLKTKMRSLISSSLKKYEAITGRHTGLLKAIEMQGLSLADLHTVLKLTRTLPLMEKFQGNNLPSTSPLQGFLQKQAEAVKLADTLSR